MARLKLREVIQDRNGVAIPSTSVYLYNVDTTTPISATLYADKTGGTTKSNPLTTDANGVIECYADAGTVDRVDLYTSPGGLGPITLADRGFEIDPADTVTLTRSQTLTNKTLASPVINTPTGDIATKTGTEELTNKTVTNPAINGAVFSGNVYWLGPTRFSVDGETGTPSQRIAACIARYKGAVGSSGTGSPGGAEIWFGKPGYDLTEPVNFSNLDGLRVQTPGGPGNSTWLYVSSYASSGIGVDITGTNSCEFNGLTVASATYLGSSAPTNKATVGWLLGSSDRGSNKNRLINCGTWGWFTTAAFAVIGASNLSLQEVAFQQFQAATVIYISANNALGLDNVATTLYDAGGSTSDISFKMVEAHSGGALGGTTGTRNGVVLRGVSNFSWDDGVNDCYSSASNHLYLESVSGVYCGNISVRNVRFYKDQSGTNAGVAIYVNDRVDGLVIGNCPIQNGISNLIGGPSGMILNRPMVYGDIAAYGFAGTVVSAASGSGGTINGGYIECAGLQINLSSSGVLNGTHLVEPGSITALTPNWHGSQNGKLYAGGSAQATGDITAGGNLKAKRLLAQTSAPTVATAVTSTGWGNTATSSISGNELAFDVTVTCNSNSGTTGITINPTIVLAWPGSAYSTAPKCSVTYSGAPNTTNPQTLRLTPSTTGLTIETFGLAGSGGAATNWTPTKTETYKWTVFVAGGA